MPPPVPRCSSRMSSSLASSGHISLPRYTSRVGLHGVHFEDCSAFTRVAACTPAPTTNSWPAIRRLQPFRCLHDCSGCFRLERFGRVGLASTEKRRLATAHGETGHLRRARFRFRHKQSSGEPQATPAGPRPSCMRPCHRALSGGRRESSRFRQEVRRPWQPLRPLVRRDLPVQDYGHATCRRHAPGSAFRASARGGSSPGAGRP